MDPWAQFGCAGIVVRVHDRPLVHQVRRRHVENERLDLASVERQPVQPDSLVRRSSAVRSRRAEVDVIRIARRFVNAVGHQRRIDERLA